MKSGSKGRVAIQLMFVAIALVSLVWLIIRPDLWLLILALDVFFIIALESARRDGLRQAAANARAAREVQQHVSEQADAAQAQLDGFQGAMRVAGLFQYELEHGLVPDGQSERNPGHGPMDFDEWHAWKLDGFERTGNAYFNHPDGRPPDAADESDER